MQQNPRLITFPVSHYCERARWALERAGVAFHEERHAQMFHTAVLKRVGGGRTVPALVLADATLGDSAEIVEWADSHVPVSDRLYPEGALGGAVRELDRRFADSLGVETRVLAYHLVLPHPRLFLPYNNHGVPWFENAATWVGFPFAVRILRRHLSIDEGTAQRARARIARELDLVAERLSDGRPYLTGESFTAADLTFAAMAAIVVFPAEYGVPFPEATSLPEPGRSEILRYRQHEAGKFALRLYRDHRRQIVATN